MRLCLYKHPFWVARCTSLATQLSTKTMSNQQYIPKEQMKLTITMLEQGISLKEISQATRFGLSTVYCVQKLWLTTSSVVKQKLEPGRPRALNSLEVNVHCHCSNCMSSTDKRQTSILRAMASITSCHTLDHSA